jgi:exosome complex component RRP40
MLDDVIDRVFDGQERQPFVVPGQNVTPFIEEMALITPRQRSDSQALKIKLGPGLVQADSQAITPVRVGRLGSFRGRKFWLRSRVNYYHPVLNDFVLGTVTHRTAEYYRVDIGWHLPATLNVLAFEGATRKNRPSLHVGSIVYARVSLADPNIEPEVSCTTLEGKTDEGFGEIKMDTLEAGIIYITPSYAQQLQLVSHPLLSLLGRQFAFESVVGANGVVCIRSGDPSLTAGLLSCIAKCEICDLEGIKMHVDELTRKQANK